MDTPIYFQTQFTNAEGQNVHSDGCSPLDDDARKFFHDLLDEWLNSNTAEGCKVTLEGPHFIICPCTLDEHLSCDQQPNQQVP